MTPEPAVDEVLQRLTREHYFQLRRTCILRSSATAVLVVERDKLYPAGYNHRLWSPSWVTLTPLGEGLRSTRSHSSTSCRTVGSVVNGCAMKTSDVQSR